MFKRRSSPVPRCGWCGARLELDELPVLQPYCSDEHAADAQDHSTV